MTALLCQRLKVGKDQYRPPQKVTRVYLHEAFLMKCSIINLKFEQSILGVSEACDGLQNNWYYFRTVFCLKVTDHFELFIAPS